MSTHPVPGDDHPAVTGEGGSARITIPAGVRDELDLQPGDQPTEIEYNPDEGEVVFSFSPEE